MQQLTEVFFTFLRLGLSAFGGPVAHIGYFRQAFVEKRQWLSDEQFTHLLSLSQFLPGPASSQLGFTLGLLRAGPLGGVAAFIAFTLPSALFLFVLSQVLPAHSGGIAAALIHGLKLLAFVVVTQAVIQMSKTLCPDWQRRTIAIAATLLMILTSSIWFQFLLILFGAIAGLLLCRDINPVQQNNIRLHYGKKTASILLLVFVVLLAGLPFLSQHPLLLVADAFYRAGALVFGGGHVVLPLLESSVVEPGWISKTDYLAAYGAAQIVPGPVFSVSAYLGAIMPGNMGGMAGATVALLAIFLPGFLLVAGMLPFWQSLLRHPQAFKAVAGVNAAVVGLLAAALYDPLWLSTILSVVDLLIVSIAIIAMHYRRVSLWLVCIWCLSASLMISQL